MSERQPRTFAPGRRVSGLPTASSGVQQPVAGEFVRLVPRPGEP